MTNHERPRNVQLVRHPLVIRLLSLAILLCALSGCSPKPHPQLIVGMELAYPPFEMIDTQGRPAGVSVDLARALGQYLDRELEIANIPFDGLIPSLQTHKIDLIISSMTATPERAKSIAFSDPYLTTGLCLLVGKSSPIQSIAEADQPGRTIVVKRGTTGHIYAADHIKKARLLVVDKEDACVLEVVQGKADAFIYDQISTYENWRRNPETTRPLLKPFQRESWAAGLRPGDAELLTKVNHFFKDYKARGGFEQLGDRYLKDQKEAFRKMGYPFYF
ncbi:MAG: transporter substrate-binding domain-containing protein [Verrucomicrobiota bacterium]|jgi:polar amino acid transport system substrate-binding protein